MGSEQAAEQPKDWVEQSDIQHTGSKQNGNDAETWVRTHYDLDPQDPDICPEAAHDAVDPRTNTPIEIKSCQIRYNHDGQRGRFQIWDYAHQILKEHDGGYVFVVHEPRTEEFTVYFHRPLSAAAVDALIGNWHPIDHQLRPDEAHRTEVSQSAVFSDIEVNRIEPSEGQDANQNDADADSEPGEDPDSDGIPQVERVKEVKDTIREIEQQHDEDLAPKSAVIAACRSKGIQESKAQHQIEELKKRGEIYMPREGMFRVT